MIYLAGWAMMYFFLFLPGRFLRKRYGAFIVIVLLSSLAILRGNVGTDTGLVYVPMVEQLNTIQGIEPLFLALLHVLTMIFPTPLFVVTMGLGTVYLILLTIYTARADEEELFMLMAFYLPAGFYFSTFSGQRFGIAMGVLLLAMQCVRLKQFKSCIVLCLIAFFTHYSSAEFLVLWGACILDPRSVRDVAITIGGTLVALVTITYAQTYIANKAGLYLASGFERPSLYSGATVVAVVFAVYAGILMGALATKAKARIIAITGVSMVVCWGLGAYSYAALRLLGMIQAVIPYAVLSIYERAGLKLGPKMRVAIIFSGLLAAGFAYRDMLNEPAPTSPDSSPTLPYRWYWQELP